ncbi:SIS domain-containing protein [Myxococcota bacterium]|nr:SIS domain-containing protein [Myxococcota bacterium]
MCGVIGLICDRNRQDLGKMASLLLRSLEYRGYDSTGAAIQGDATDAVDLRKGVGAPSVLVDDLGISSMQGRVACGQVRWATFGAVDAKNAQPHVVRCKTFLYGAHNGNVTNTEALREKLIGEGHLILSDNDGEMLVHTVEHHFALELEKLADPADAQARKDAMRRALVRTQAAVEGSFAAIVVDPVTHTGWALKSGSSLYFGIGRDALGPFQIASSDLSSILKFTRVLLPLEEGEAVEFDHTGRQVFALREKKSRDGVVSAGAFIERAPVRSRLRAKDTELSDEFTYFMEQEIFAQSQTARSVITKYLGGSRLTRQVRPILDPMAEERAQVLSALARLSELTSDDRLSGLLHELADHPAMRALLQAVDAGAPAEYLDLPVGNESLGATFSSSEMAVFADMLPFCTTAGMRRLVRILDTLVELQETEETALAAGRFARYIEEARKRGNHIYVAACGSSYHAAMAACLFFNEIAFTELIPILPGEFRGRYSNTVKDHDVVIAVSQSGETKDLIDILNDIGATGRSVRRIAIVNNVNSTIALEKSDLVIPLRCGPEIAVPATKSFINQITVFYTLALETAARQIESGAGEWTAELVEQRRGELADRMDKLERIPELIERTIQTTREQVVAAAGRIYFSPSIQLLATRMNAVAREGALKIREVVLNHTEGFEGAEFKHGPNTILGFNTVYGPEHFSQMLAIFTDRLQQGLSELASRGLGFASARRMVNALCDHARGNPAAFQLNTEEQEIFASAAKDYVPLTGFSVPYPLIYITGPAERDVRLTISQLNTHKIRGSCTIVIAEENHRLRQAAEKPPGNGEGYWAQYITLPRTDDSLLPVFTSTLVLQLLALEMSVRKMQALDNLGIAGHGVHPDVPKNVSKSITVD